MAPHFIGKESNKLEEVEEGGVPDAKTFIPSIPIRGAMNGKQVAADAAIDAGSRAAGARRSRATIYAARSGRDLYKSTKAKLIARP